MAEGKLKAPLFPTDWIEQVRDIIDNNKSLANAVAIPRVAKRLLNVKRDPYIPHFVSLGPYHHWNLNTDFESFSVEGGCYQYPDLKMSTAEAYKIQSAATLWQRSHSHGKSLDDIVEKIEGMKQEIEHFYRWPIVCRENNYSKNFALMMAIDASFLLSFLFTHPDITHPNIRISLSTLEVCTKCDILKLENQIPLSVLRNVFEDQKSERHQDFNKLLEDACNELSPFDFVDAVNYNQIDMAKEPHLLGFMHAFISPFLQMQPSRMDMMEYQRSLLQSTTHFLEVVVAAVLTTCVRHPTKKGQRDFLNAYNAVQLAKWGIKFKSYSTPPHRIRFDTYSGTLYLPRITISHMQTEVFLRNMMALEFNDVTGRNHVTRYVGLMDCIIDSPEDVRVLRDSHVIRRGSLVLTDDWIAKMWNGMCHPFFTGQLEHRDDLKDALEEVLVRKYYMSIVRKWIWEVYWEHLSKPGKGVALLVGFLILAMTVVQTYCSLSQLSPKH